MAPAIIAAILGAATAATSAGIGISGSAAANRDAANKVSDQKKKNKQWYDMKSSEDFLSSSVAQATFKKQKELIDEQYRRARATNIVAGGTDESLAMQQQAGNNSLADTATGVALQGTARKDAAEQTYLQRDAALTDQQVNLDINKSNQIAQAASQGVSAGLNLIGAGLSSGLTNTKKPGTTQDAAQVTK